VFKLTIEDDEGKTTVIPLIRDEMTIGRQDGNTIRLTERNISRRHARLVRQNGTMFVEDLASYTGVKVNGARIVAMTPVAEGDEVQIGDYKLMVRVDRPAVQGNPDRATMPAMPAALGGPMNSIGGSVAIPTRGTPAMAAQAAAAPPTRQSPVVALEVARQSAPAPVVRPSAPVPHGLTAVPDPLEAQPTIPVRTLAEVPGIKPSTQTNARLVILTSELAGQEFSLARASAVIGRTEENDIVINHRSISRHHAKIVREGDRYTIVDLQSANGVRVNNEDYERVELNPGDVVELGHVKLRFVGPFEHYVFDPNVRHDARPFPMKIVAGAGSVVLVGLIALVLRGNHTPEISSVAPPPPITPTVPAATPPTPQALFAEATRAATAEDWAAARAALDKLGAATGDAALDRQAADLGKRVDAEKQASVAFAKFGEAATARQYADALARYADLPDGSTYKARARTRADEVRSLLVAERLAAAEQARAAGRCADVRTEADEIEKLDPKNTLAKELVRLCRAKPEPVAKAARPRPVAAVASAARAERPTERAAERAEAAAPAEPEVDAEALMKQAREAWLKQQCGSAMELARKALKAKPGMTDGYQIIAVCSCSLKDVEGATRAYAKLDEKSRNLVRSLCQKNGVIVGNSE
jgi:pSer/pThr/pTyr-binding forkhead associated (FHA) protein